MNEKRRAVEAMVRQDLKSHLFKVFETVTGDAELLDNWHLDALAHHLSACARGEIKRLIITLPPRNLKSLFASVAFPTWLMGHDPSCQIICASYSEDLATTFARDRRKVFDADWFRKSFPETKIGGKEKDTERETATTKGGKCIAVSVKGTLTGKGGAFIIIDDPIKAGEAMSESERNAVNERYRNTIYSRLNKKKDGVIIIVMQRVHMDDLVGHVQDLDEWVVLNLPAIAQEDQKIPIGDGEFYHREKGEILHPEFEDHDDLMKTKKILGSSNFAAQYLQSPIPPEGKVYKRKWIQRYKGTLDKDAFPAIYQSWDTAFETSDNASFSVCTTWGIRDAEAYLLDVYRDRLIYPLLKAKVIHHARYWGADRVIIEKASSGQALLQDLVGKLEINFIAFPPRQDKLARAEQVSAIVEAGRVYFPEEAEWLGDLESEIFTFPECRHTDQTDSISQFLLYWECRGPAKITARVRTVSSQRSTYYDRMGGSFPD